MEEQKVTNRILNELMIYFDLESTVDYKSEEIGALYADMELYDDSLAAIYMHFPAKSVDDLKLLKLNIKYLKEIHPKLIAKLSKINSSDPEDFKFLYYLESKLRMGKDIINGVKLFI